MQQRMAVLGGGISGIVAADALAAAGHQVTLLEPRERLGGNFLSREIGPFTFDIGAFMFFPGGAFFKRFPGAERLCIASDMPIERVTPQGRVHAFPYSMKQDLFGQGPAEVALSALSLLAGRLRHDPDESSGSFARHYLGARLFERSGLAHYIERFNGVPADEVEACFAQQRLEWLPRAAQPIAMLKRMTRKPVSTPASQSLVRPAQGFAPMFEDVRDELGQRGVAVRTGFAIDGIRKHANGLTITGGGEEIAATQVISTLPVDLTARLCGINDIPELPSLTLLSLFIRYRGDLGFPSTILYNFSKECRWKRLTVHSRAYGSREGYEYLNVEVPFPERMTSVSADEEFAAFMDFMQQRGMMLDAADLIGHEFTGKAYPVYKHGTQAAAAEIVERIGHYGVDMLGRQGQFAYIATSWDAARRAERFIAGKPALH